MGFIEWRPYLETGLTEVDAQHRGLVDMLNQAAPLLAASGDTDRAGVGRLLDGLLAYAAIHFRTEEKLMADTAMEPAALEHHRATHARFAERVAAMAAQFTGGGRVSGDQLLSFLASWLVIHIMGEDQAMARQIQAIRGGSPPAVAHREARGDDLGPAPEALSRAMVDIYTLLTRQYRELSEAHARILKQNDDLEGLVRARTAQLERLTEDLRRARDAAESASAAKSRFLGTVSHELRTPMNTILGLSRLLRDQDLAPVQGDLARRIVDSSERLLELLSGIIDYARMSEGERADLAHAPFNIAVELAEICEPAFVKARQKGLQVRVDVDPIPGGALVGPIGHIRRILGLFLSNAVKFTEHGGIQVAARKVAAPTPDATRVRFSIADSGPGIPEGYLARLFEPFSQADDRADRHHEGLGLGLALARELAKAIGGEIGAESRAGGGSTFWLELDIRTAPDEARPRMENTRQDPRSDQGGARVGRETSDTMRPLPAPLRQDLMVLGDLLRVCDTRAGSELNRLAPLLQPYMGDHVDRLARLVAAFDYDNATILLRSLLEVPPQP